METCYMCVIKCLKHGPYHGVITFRVTRRCGGRAGRSQIGAKVRSSVVSGHWVCTMSSHQVRLPLFRSGAAAGGVSAVRIAESRSLGVHG